MIWDVWGFAFYKIYNTKKRIKKKKIRKKKKIKNNNKF